MVLVDIGRATQIAGLIGGHTWDGVLIPYDDVLKCTTIAQSVGFEACDRLRIPVEGERFQLHRRHVRGLNARRPLFSAQYK
nr:hypothetical protein [Anaeromyxobacter dehalogenans]